MNKLLPILLYLWQLPQNLLGLLLVAVLRPEASCDYCGRRLYYSTRMKGAISLGRYIIVRAFLKKYEAGVDWTRAHEYGHSLQSLFLGPLYLPIVGIPSLLWAAIWRPEFRCSYYAFYTEAWADKLGGVERC